MTAMSTAPACVATVQRVCNVSRNELLGGRTVPPMTNEHDNHGVGQPLPGALRLAGRDLLDARLVVRDVICGLADEWTASGVAGGWFAAFDRAARLLEALGPVEHPLVAPGGALGPDLTEALVEFAAEEVRLAWQWLQADIDDVPQRTAIEEREARATRVLARISESGEN